MEVLRGVGGCPWDTEQTHESLRTTLTEEAYEAVQAINEDDMDALCEELGDVLLQVVFHSQIAREDGDFNIFSVTTALAKKMIYRHPHVFGEKNFSDSHTVLKNWDRLKYEKRGIHTLSERLEDIKGLPALLATYKVQRKVSDAGMDFSDCDTAYQKLLEEMKKAEEEGKADRVESEVGNLLFSVVNASRLLGVDPEVALMRSLNEFKSRISFVERRLKELGKSFEDSRVEEMALLWNEAKEH